MSKKSTFTYALALLIKFLFLTSSSIAQQLESLRLESTVVPDQSPVRVFVDFTPAERNWCGFFIDWGDGLEHQSFRIGKPPDLASPVTRTRVYAKPGVYKIRAYGQFVSKGLNSATACDGTLGEVSVRVAGPNHKGQVDVLKLEEELERQRRMLQEAQNALNKLKGESSLSKDLPSEREKPR